MDKIIEDTVKNEIEFRNSCIKILKNEIEFRDSCVKILMSYVGCFADDKTKLQMEMDFSKLVENFFGGCFYKLEPSLEFSEERGEVWLTFDRKVYGHDFSSHKSTDMMAVNSISPKTRYIFNMVDRNV